MNGTGGSPYFCYYQMCNSDIYAWEPHHQSRQIFISETHVLKPYPRFIKHSKQAKYIIVAYSVLSESKNYIDIFSIGT